MAMDRSPGAMAAVLTEGQEMQAPHLGLIDAAFERVAAGVPPRLLLTMPPRHGKSRRAARWAPLWYLRRRPEHRVMIASYSSDLADDHGRWIRDAILTYGPQIGIDLRPGSSAANRFDLLGTEGGAVMAGVGGGLPGKGAHLAVVDDPIKDAAEASSPTMRRRLWEWWQAVLLTRIEPGGSAILIQTRVIDLPALALAGPPPVAPGAEHAGEEVRCCSGSCSGSTRLGRPRAGPRARPYLCGWCSVRTPLPTAGRFSKRSYVRRALACCRCRRA
ncbi:terminase large subunit domain-containing protein [Streptomyces sp. NPDC016562]|uniref:terminase large subunit domain-containing protein n=1 Tax=Streptomyces sp. NPDC016562 TaxID=3364966 RepID=UPI0036FD6193